MLPHGPVPTVVWHVFFAMFAIGERQSSLSIAFAPSIALVNLTRQNSARGGGKHAFQGRFWNGRLCDGVVGDPNVSLRSFNPSVVNLLDVRRGRNGERRTGKRKVDLVSTNVCDVFVV